MRRSSLLLLATLILLATACGDDQSVREPALPTVDFTPSGFLVVDEDGITCEIVDDVEQCRVTAGSVLEARNDGASNHRLRSDIFDTGIMKPGDVTTIVISDIGEHDVRADDNASVVTLMVAARD